jgi:hypothetical protein
MLIGLRGTVSAFNVPILRGLGNSRGPLMLTGLGALLTALLVSIAAPLGLVAITLAMLARSVITWPIGASLVREATGLTMLEQARAGAAPIAAATVMGALVMALTYIIKAPTPWTEVAILTAAGAAVYVAVLFLLAPPRLRAQLVRLSVSALHKRKVPQSASKQRRA